jgi:cellulose synthase/poly-beta-1,6-N-acetylglucosamine synthase-like glycosyltransferase
MRAVLRPLWWLAAIALGWTYAGFPLVLFLRARLRSVPVAVADIEPTVSMVIAAHNEAASIEGKIENALGLDYPTDHLEVIVASDGSTDETVRIVERFADRRVRVLDLDRSGKAAALEKAIALATGEVLVFSDANSLYDADAIRALVRPLADPRVGGVAGDQRYTTERPGQSASGERSYWDIDRRLKRAESEAGNVVSATGAIYAVRSGLIRGVARGVTDDFAVSTGVIEQGYRLVFAADAVALEQVSPTEGHEFSRKVRIMTRGLRGVLLRRALLDPRRTGFYSVQLLTHKLLRRLMFVPLLLLAVSSPLLARRGTLYRLATAGQMVAYGLAAVGLARPDSVVGGARPVKLAAFFVAANAAAARATWNVVRGVTIDKWEPAERGGDR